MSQRNGGQGVKSKRRVKKRKPHYAMPYSMFLDQADKDAFEAVLNKIGLITEITLPLGQCTMDDVQLMRDMFNLGSIFRDKAIGHAINPEYVAENEELWMRLAKVFPDYYFKALDGCFVCTAEEMNVLRDGIAFVGNLIRAEFESEPAWVFKCYRALKHRVLKNEYQMLGNTENPGMLAPPNELETAVTRAVNRSAQIISRPF